MSIKKYLYISSFYNHAPKLKLNPKLERTPLVYRKLDSGVYVELGGSYPDGPLYEIPPYDLDPIEYDKIISMMLSIVEYRQLSERERAILSYTIKSRMYNRILEQE